MIVAVLQSSVAELQVVFERTIQYILQKHLKMLSCVVTMKLLLTEKMKAKRLSFPRPTDISPLKKTRQRSCTRMSRPSSASRLPGQGWGGQRGPVGMTSGTLWRQSSSLIMWWFGAAFRLCRAWRTVLFAKKNHYECRALTDSAGRSPTAVHGLPWMQTLPFLQDTTPWLQGHKVVPAPADLPGHQLAW